MNTRIQGWLVLAMMQGAMGFPATSFSDDFEEVKKYEKRDRHSAALVIRPQTAAMRWPLLLQPLAKFGPAGEPAKSTGPAPATVSHRVAEADLTTLTLTPEAVKRLAIKTVAVREGKISRRRFLGGETMVPPGRSIQLVAPFAGTIVAIDGKAPPPPGSILANGDPILRLQPIVMGDREILTPSERISMARAAADFEAAEAQADGDVSAARVKLDAARVRLKRTQRLRVENVTSEKSLDEAKADFELAQAHLEAAKAKALAWKEAAHGMHADPQIALDLVAPFDGVLSDLSVMPGEVIGVNSPVARLISVDPLWVRVPVYVGARHELDLQGEVRVGALGGRLLPDQEIVEHIAGVPTADSMSASVDLFFRLSNPQSRHRPQERLGV